MSPIRSLTRGGRGLKLIPRSITVEDLRNKLNIDLPRAKGAYLDDAPSEIWDSSDWVLEIKEDGTRESLQIGRYGSLMVGRNREDQLKGVDNAGAFMVHPHPVFDLVASADFEGTILDGECTMHFTKDGEHDETTKVRLREGAFVGYTVWGCIFYKGQDVRNMTESYRRKCAHIVIAQLNHPNIRLVERMPATLDVLAQIHASGEEGAIAKRLDGTIPTTQRTCPTWWKLKTEQTVDAFITGVTEGKEGGSGVQGIKATPSGKAASITVSMFKDHVPGIARGMKILQVAKVKHLPEDLAADVLANFEQYKNRVVELRVSGWNGKAFRWSRLLKFREDKLPIDCKFDEQVGNT